MPPHLAALAFAQGACTFCLVAASSEGVAVSVVDLAQDDHDHLDEGPGEAHNGADDGDGEDELCNAHPGLAEVEVVHAKRAKEKGQQKGDQLLFRGGGGHRGLCRSCFHNGSSASQIISLPPERRPQSRSQTKGRPSASGRLPVAIMMSSMSAQMPVMIAPRPKVRTVMRSCATPRPV